MEYLKKVETPGLELGTFNGVKDPIEKRKYLENRFKELNRFFLMYHKIINGDKTKGKRR